VNYFSSDAEPDLLPENWRATDIGEQDVRGVCSYAKGIFTLAGHSRLKGNQGDANESSFFAGIPWTGDGEWTMHVIDSDETNPNAPIGLVLRAGLDPKSGMMFQLGVSGSGSGKIFKREVSGSYFGHSPELDIPLWLRLTRIGRILIASISNEGVSWSVFNQNNGTVPDDLLVGFYVSGQEKPPGKFHIEHVTFSPRPASSEIVPGGVLLRSGSFLAGNFDAFDLTVANAKARFKRKGKPLDLTPAQISAITFYPTPCNQLDHGESSGLLLKNGDFTSADIQGFQPGDPDTVSISSVQLGVVELGERFGSSGNQAAILHAMEPQASDYEIRLKDGSSLRTNHFMVSNDQVQIDEISGPSVVVGLEEVAQLRAGRSRVQNLLELPSSLVALPPPKPDKNAATAPPESPLETWEGDSQEQMGLSFTRCWRRIVSLIWCCRDKNR